MLAPSLDFEDDDDPVALLVLAFEKAWRSGPPRIDKFRGRLEEQEANFGLAELVKADLQQRFQRGERPSARDYFERFPDLIGEDGHALTLIYEEYCLLAKTGDAVSPSAFCDRYPTWHGLLASQLAYHHELSRAVEPMPTVSDFPEKGDWFVGYKLDRIVGQGAAARVFVARDGDLSDKEFVIKISRDKGTEAAALGKLDHVNIVGVHRVLNDPTTGFRGLCMPYRPGLALNDVLTLFRRGERKPSLRSIEEVVRPRHSHDRVEEESRSGWADFPAAGSYADGVAWIGIKVALALEHAHKFGIFHRDVKPENILITWRDGVQLIDFNLACDTNLGDLARAAHRGGTLPYMAREHLQAFLDPTLWPKVDARANLFSLGLVLRELLTLKSVDRIRDDGDLPRTINDLIQKRAAPRTPIRQINPKVPHALEAIVAKCLGEAPEDRYQTADDLAKDLRCYLARRPLIVAKNESNVEVARNWLTARRQVAAVTGVVACLVGFFSLRDAGQPRPMLVEESTSALIERLRIEIGRGNEAQSTRLAEMVLKRPDAEKELHDASEAHPESFTIAMTYAKASSNAHKLEDAIKAYRRAIDVDPTSVAFRGLAQAQVESKDYPAAFESIDREVDLFHDQGTAEDHLAYIEMRSIRAHVCFLLGDAAMDEEEFPTARNHFLKALDDLKELDERSPATTPTTKFTYHYLSALTKASIGDLHRKVGSDAEALMSYKAAREHVDAARRDATISQKGWLDQLEQKLNDRLLTVVNR